MAVQEIYEIMCQYCRGDLLAPVTNTINSKESFELFNAHILEQFVPVRQLSKLRIEKYKGCNLRGNTLLNTCNL